VKKNSIKPSKWYYGLAILIFVSGSSISTFIFHRYYSHFEKSVQRFVVPGGHTVNFSSQGNYTIFYEYRSVVGDKVFNTGSELKQKIVCQLVDKSGKEVHLRRSRWSKKYASLNGPEGVSLLDFKIHEPGTYILSGSYQGEQAQPDIVLAITAGFTGNTIFVIGICAIISIVTLGLSGYIGYKTFVKRRQNAY
jgi:hypothetical protein